MKSICNAVIISAVRTPIGGFLGNLSSLSATQLGSIVVQESVKRTGMNPSLVDEVIMGNVLSAGMGQAPARQSALGAKLPRSVECTTVNKVCGSGLKSVMLATQAIMLGDADVIVAGGMESMSNVPYYLQDTRSGYKMGHQNLVDGMIKDGLWDVYNDFHMGNAAELCAKEYSISRKSQDDYAAMSYRRALKAQEDGLFLKEIIPVSVTQHNRGVVNIDADEEPARVRFDKIPSLKPVFDKNGTITVANASSINDGAAAVVIMSSEKAEELNIKPMAKIVAHASAAKDPEWFTTAPVDAIKKVLRKVDLKTDDIDLFEINEAFAVVSIVVNNMLKLDIDRVNINGGALALGHPIGASGARILVTLLHAMQKRKVKRGLASLCLGGGEASALIVERQ